jgi:hypothetical protein
MPSLVNNAVTVSSTATLLVDGSPRRSWLSVRNNGVVDVYLGNASVSSTAFSWLLAPGEVVQFTTEAGDKLPENKWYGRTASSTASVSVGESLP